MATLLAFGDIISAKVFCYSSPQGAVNQYHYYVNATTALSVTLSEAAVAMEPSFAAAYPPLLSTSAVYSGMKFTRERPLPMPLSEIINNVNAGTDTGGPLPQQTSGVLTKLTGLTGVANRGRVYLPFPAGDANAGDGHPSAAYKAALVTLASSVLTPFTIVGASGTATLVPVIWRRGTLTTTVVTSYKAQPKWGTQRRRSDYGRRDAFVIS